MSTPRRIRELLAEQERRLKALEALAPPEERRDLTVLCLRSGQHGETRPLGLHFRDPVRRVGPELVFDGNRLPEELLARFGPRGRRPGPLVLIEGPAHIEPPDDMP